MHKTTNGGTSFLPGILGYETFCIFFLSPDLGWAVGRDGNISKTTDNATWPAQISGTTEGFNDVFFIDTNTGWVPGQSKVLKTTDGGATWVAHSIENFCYPTSICFSNSNTGWIAIGQGTLKSTDGGNSWSLFTPEADRGNIIGTYQIRFVDNMNGMLIGTIENQPNFWFCYTNDGGNNWISQPCSTIETINHMNVIDMNIAYAVGSLGTIIKISK